MNVPISEAKRLVKAIQYGGVDEWDVASIMEYGYHAWLMESDSRYAREQHDIDAGYPKGLV